ncbi:MAG: hypothetical protein KHX55_00910 [Proteobacteria bacterium]|nr:hypothetical protein [Pseudomonadota bacterium]
MYEQLAAIFSSIDIIGSISSKIDLLTGLVDGYLSGANNLRLVSIILMILALILFLFLIIIIYVKTIVAFLKKEPQDESAAEEDEIFSEEDAERLREIIRNQERDMELEKELQKELDMARAERNQALLEQAAENERKEKEKTAQKEKQRQEEKNKQISAEAEKEKEPAADILHRVSRPSPQIDLDWKKGTLPRETAAPVLDTSTLTYHQANKELNELLGLIIDMLGRGVDDLKIAQTVMFRNQNINSEDDILQTIDAIKYFVDLSRNQAFAKLPNIRQLPDEEEALYHLAKGDASLALTLMESLMDSGIEKAAQTTAEAKRDALYKNISEQACVFGTLAAANDVMLATGAFELAIELSPNNANAWSRVGDMYMKADSPNKAIWAYQNAVNFADEEINARELANAHKHLSQHLYDQGNSLQAAKLYNSSKQFYDSLGINRRLDKQEIEIVEIIEAHHNDDLRLTIHNLLNASTRQSA